ncbi:unnamed protein product, partial [Effrenium voratum]
DLALDAWVDQVSHVNQMDEKLTISELQKMAEFFSHHSYGPYNACSGKLVEAEEFHCEKYYQGEDWGRINVEPDRSASALLVHTKTFLVSFDMTRPVKVKAAIALLSNLFTVVVMLFFGVALSAVVTDLAVTPLERMLGTVREIAATVFKFSSLMVGQEDDEGQPEETTEIDNAGEMILLEKALLFVWQSRHMKLFLQQIQELLKGAPATPVETAFPCATGPSDHCLVKFSDREIKVVIGTSEHIQQPLVDQICHIVDAAYSKVGKHKRVDRYDAVDRLEMGDAGPQANRVLHLAFLGEVLVGCASSTFSPGWTPEGCGHWGLLAVHPDYQNSKVATALVIAAERRLATISAAVQIEYQYTEGEDFST